MRELPILFSTPMVQAILAGRKTMTRRLVDGEPIRMHHFGGYSNDPDVPWPADYGFGALFYSKGNGLMEAIKCPYQVGDQLWVRETFEVTSYNLDQHTVEGFYTADPRDFNEQLTPAEWAKFLKWKKKIGRKPNLFLFKSLARIWSEITDIRVERLQDISEADAAAEGVIPIEMEDGEITSDGKGYSETLVETYKEGFQRLWESLHGPGSWDANPWLWVYSFKVLSTTGRPATTFTVSAAAAEFLTQSPYCKK